MAENKGKKKKLNKNNLKFYRQNYINILILLQQWFLISGPPY